MNTKLQAVLNFCTENKLTVNIKKKTNYMIIKSSRKKIPNIELPQFKQTEYIKYLGVYIDENLTWDKQINFILSKISKNNGIIRRLRHYVNLKTLQSLYYTLIYPYFSYGILSWDSTYKTKLSRICTAQNKCYSIRSLFFANQRETANPLYTILEFLTFENIQSINTLLQNP